MHSTFSEDDEIYAEYVDAGADSYISKSTGSKKLAERIIHEYTSVKNLN